MPNCPVSCDAEGESLPVVQLSQTARSTLQRAAVVLLFIYILHAYKHVSPVQRDVFTGGGGGGGGGGNGSVTCGEEV